MTTISIMTYVQPEANASPAGVTEAAATTAAPSLFVRWLMQAGRWPMYLVFIVLFIQICRLARFPSMRFNALGVYFLWIVLLFIWSVLRTLWVLHRSETPLKRLLHWSAPPALLVTAMVLPHSGLPCRWSFEMNRAAFDRLAQQVMASPRAMHVQSIGPYDTSQVGCVEPTPGSKAGAEVVVTLSRTGEDLSRYGFAYHPDGRPHNPYDQDLGGGWYV